MEVLYEKKVIVAIQAKVDIDEKETKMCINERKVLKNNAISPIYAQNYAGFKISFLSYARCSGWGYKRPWSPR